MLTNHIKQLKIKQFMQEKLNCSSTFNSGLVLIGFPTTQPIGKHLIFKFTRKEREHCFIYYSRSIHLKCYYKVFWSFIAFIFWKKMTFSKVLGLNSNYSEDLFVTLCNFVFFQSSIKFIVK